jgi:diguanylate cyclase (GGDEF)-like protein
MGSPDRIRLLLAPILLCILYGSLRAQEANRQLRTLVAAREVHDLSRAEAARAYPVHLRAVVTYFDPELNELPDLFMHDATGGIFVEFSQKTDIKLQNGDLVDVSGVSGPGDFAPVVDQPRVRVIGRSHLPEHAQKVTFSQLVSGSLDGQWVEIEGVVHAAHFTAHNVTLDLATNGGPLRATTLREPGTDYEALVDSRIAIRGDVAPVFNWKMQMVGGQLVFPSVGEITVVKAAAGDPFLLPAVPLSQLTRYSPTMGIPHRVHVQGRVILQWPGRKLCIRQESSTLCMDTTQTDRVSEGSRIDAIGFPASSDYKETLENATYHLAGDPSFHPIPHIVTASQALQGDDDGQLVQMEGELVDQEHIGEDLQLMLRSGAILIPAILPLSLAGKSASAWKDGSILRLTGLCNGQVGAETWNLRNGEVQPGSVQILLRSASDVRVLERPSWWTPQHALGILLAVALFAIAAAAWILVLRQRVEQQTRALRDSEEKLRYLSQHDALTGLPNRTLLNDRIHVALHRAKRFRERLGLLMVDIDHFKEANDTYGHPMGDLLLCTVANRISASARKTDTVARIGGDEFIVLLPDLGSPKDAELVAAKILAAISAPVAIGTASVSITVSIGVCTYPDGGTELEDLLRSADAAMYFAKGCGRNALHVSHPTNV